MFILLLACTHHFDNIAPLNTGSGILEIQVRPNGVPGMDATVDSTVEPYGGSFEISVCGALLEHMVEAGGYNYGYCRMISGSDTPFWYDPMLRRTGDLVWLGAAPPEDVEPDVVMVVRPEGEVQLVTRMGRGASGAMEAEILLTVEHKARFEWWNKEDGTVAVMGWAEDHRQRVISNELWDALQTPTLPEDTPLLVNASLQSLVRKMDPFTDRAAPGVVAMR